MIHLLSAISDQRCRPHRLHAPGVRPSFARTAFTFTEVLFAVMLLGIGFIMVAAIFPVAIQQSQANRDDTTGVVIAKAGAKVMQTLRFSRRELEFVTSGHRLPGIVHPFDDRQPIPFIDPFTGKRRKEYDYTRYSKIKGVLLDQTNRRYAWVPLGYKLAMPLHFPHLAKPVIPSYEVYILAVACRNKAAYDDDDINGGTFLPKEVFFVLHEGDLDPDWIGFSSSRSRYSPHDHPAAAEGAFVLVADDQLPLGHPLFGQANGRLYRLGVRRTGPDAKPGQWELLPGHDMTFTPDSDPDINENLPPRRVGDPPSGKPALGYMIGRGYLDPLDSAARNTRNLNPAVQGPAQDLFAMPITITLPLE